MKKLSKAQVLEIMKDCIKQMNQGIYDYRVIDSIYTFLGYKEHDEYSPRIRDLYKELKRELNQELSVEEEEEIKEKE